MKRKIDGWCGSEIDGWCGHQPWKANIDNPPFFSTFVVSYEYNCNFRNCSSYIINGVLFRS
ncbi:MAG: hypothetical protein ACKVOW_09490 [Chitinophagaceae bacterium]